MKQRIVYDLTEDEVKKVAISFRFIDDRTKHSDYIKGNKRMVQPFFYDRRIDMFWINLEFEGINLGSLAIDPTSINNFRISRNHCKVGIGYADLIARATSIFLASDEYQHQRRWMQKRKELDKKSIDLNFTEPLELSEYNKLFGNNS